MPPLPHPKLSRTLRELAASSDHRARCSDPPPPLLVRGVHEFNSRQFFECHETLEVLWRQESHPVRYLYQGILHVGVGYYHLQRGNHHGAITKLRTGCQLLERYPPRCQGVAVAALVKAAQGSLERLQELGPEGIRQLDESSIPRIKLMGPHPEPHRGPLPIIPTARSLASEGGRSQAPS